MKHPIPSDWGGEQWHCIQLQWPDSREWDVILLGLLSYAKLGRIWDERTGSVRDTQQIGWAIWDKNAPFVACDDCPDCPDCPPPQDCPDCPDSGGGTTGECLTCSEGASDEGDEEMGQVVTDVQIVNGKIRVFFGKCCYEDLDATGLTVDTSESIPDDIYDPLLPPATTYSACGRAKAVHEAVVACTDAMWDQRLNPLVWQWIGRVEDAVGVGNLSNNMIISGIEAALHLELFTGEETVFDESNMQRALCFMVESFEATNGDLSDTEWDAIKSAYTAAFGIYTGSIWGYAVLAIGKGTLSRIAKAGAVNQTADCGCPSAPVFENIGIGYDWRYVYDFRDGVGAWNLSASTHQDPAYGLWGDGSGDVNNRTTPEATLQFTDVANGSTLQCIGIVVDMLGAPENIDNSQVWVGTDDTIHIGGDQLVLVTGDNPTTPGQHQVVVFANNGLGSLELQFKVKLFAYHETDHVRDNTVENSQRIVAVLFAGSGPGPMVSA